MRPIGQTFATLGCLVFAVLMLTFPSVQAQHLPGVVGPNGGPPSFDVASIKPSRPDDENHRWVDTRGRLSIENFTLRQIIQVAYGLKLDSQVLGGPRWIDSDRFDIVAKADDVETQKMEKMTRDQWVSERTIMLQTLLADRFGLKVSRGEKTLPAYALVVIKSGAKFAPAATNDGKDNLSVHSTHMVATSVSMDALANYLMRMPEAEEREVVNHTGLVGAFDFKLDWKPDRDNGVTSDAVDPGLLTALREQLGLELKPAKARTEVIIVKSASKPVSD